MGPPADLAEFEKDGLSRTDDRATMGFVNMPARVLPPPYGVAPFCGVTPLEDRRLRRMKNLAEYEVVAAVR